jgi:hypothetical protein
VLRSALLLSFLFLSFSGLSEKTEGLRYFAVWSYAENAPREEISAHQLGERQTGYWALEFDEKGWVVRGTYQAADGMTWLSLRYVEQDGKVYADMYGPDGQFLSRKSTTLPDRKPHWPGTVSE